MKYFINQSFSIVIIICIITIGLKAQTYVSGGIYSNTIWTAANSPYIVVDTTVVFPNVILTIEPGVVVKFENNKRLEIRQASIIASGTITDSITFTSNSLSPFYSIWSGIYLNGSKNSEFNYCNFKYGNNCIEPYNMIGTLNITNSNFNFNNIGLGPIYYGQNLVDSCYFRNNNYAVKGYCCYPAFLKINNCNITNNQYGIFQLPYSTINNCAIDSNSIIGIEDSYTDTIKQSKIRFNGIGLSNYYAGSAPTVITENTIENNDIGMKLSSWDESIYCNKICNNTTYNIYYNVSFGSNLNASNNYWCTSDSAMISANIYDGYDNISLGLVDFMPIDTFQCQLVTGITINEYQIFSFIIFPNPAYNYLIVELQSNISKTEIKIFNMLGNLEYFSNGTRQNTNIDISTLSSGLHIIQISMGNMISRQKFIKQ